jgi:SfnB family sulfur acquisition oxidoreductase
MDAVPFQAARLRTPPAHVIRDDAEALAAAALLAAQFAPGAAARDRDRVLPGAELERMSDAGLFAITVPAEFGGAGVSSGTVARVIALLSGADGSIGQIPQNHFFMLEALRLQGTAEQKRFFYGRVLAGERVFNALSETGTKTAHDHATALSRDGDGYRLRGQKFYSTGALFAHWVAVVANSGERRSAVAFVPRDAPGLAVIDDWTGFGQRTTGSGTTVLDDVAVSPFQVLDFTGLFERPTPMGPFAQLMHAAVEQGIAEAALADTVVFVRRARPWRDSGVEKASLDPYVVAIAGEMKIRTDASAVLLDRAARFVDVAAAGPDDDSVAAASVAVAEAKAASTETALFVTSKLIELGGSAATLAEHGLDRHWRNARTHTVHDPVRWKYKLVGDWWLNGVRPPRHGAV